MAGCVSQHCLRQCVSKAMCLPKSRRDTGAVQEPEEIALIGLVWEPFFKDSCSQMYWYLAAASAKYQL